MHKQELELCRYGQGIEVWDPIGSAGVWVVTGSRARRRRACSVFLLADSFATTGLKPCFWGVGGRSQRSDEHGPGCAIKRVAAATGGGSSLPAPSLS